MNQANTQRFSMRSVPLLYKRLFDEELDFFKMLELSSYVLRQCGGIATDTFVTQGTLENNRVKLPTDIYAIKSVSAAGNYPLYSSLLTTLPKSALFNYNLPSFMEPVKGDDKFTQADHGQCGPGIPERFFPGGPQNAYGTYLDYHNEHDGCLYVPHYTGDVEVVFTATDMDEEGYPTITESVQIALAYYCYFVKQQQRFFRREIDGSAFGWIDQEKGKKIAQARTPLAVSDNELDDILEMMLSHNRKTLRTPYLPKR